MKRRDEMRLVAGRIGHEGRGKTIGEKRRGERRRGEERSWKSKNI